MKNRVEELVKELSLLPHPEGGFYKETYRSTQEIGNRNLQTAIFFLITDDNVSRFHKIKSDELWFFHEGSSLTVHTLDPKNGHQELRLGLDIASGESPQTLVTADTIFGSCLSEGKGYALVSCTVAPGFDFEDFQLYETQELLDQYPEHSAIVNKLT